jgi:hypothetical protein
VDEQYDEEMAARILAGRDSQFPVEREAILKMLVEDPGE